MKLKRVLVTGASGFVGRPLCAELRRAGYAVRAAVREPARGAGIADEVVSISAIGGDTNWLPGLAGVDVVIHLAARVHVMHESAADPLAEFRRVNMAGTERLARAAAASGVRRLVFVSSIKVNGEATAERPFTSDDAARPCDPYGVSKWEGECALRRIADAAGLEVTVVRPPLVYGPGVGGNFLRLLRLVRRGIPLPFGAIDNRRSMIYNGNLASALIACAVQPAAAGKTYLVSDGDDLSTPELIRHLGAMIGKSARLWPFPPSLLRLAGRMLGKSAELDRLLGSLVIDSGPIRRGLSLDTFVFGRRRLGRHSTVVCGSGNVTRAQGQAAHNADISLAGSLFCSGPGTVYNSTLVASFFFA